MLTVKTEVVVAWGDCDPANIVFYPNYFAWFDTGSHALFAAVGLSPEVLRNEHGLVGLPIVDTHARFLLPSRYGDILTIESGVTNWSQKSFTVGHRILKGDELGGEGHEIRIWARRHPDNPDRLKTYPIPDAVRRRFSD